MRGAERRNEAKSEESSGSSRRQTLRELGYLAGRGDRRWRRRRRVADGRCPSRSRASRCGTKIQVGGLAARVSRRRRAGAGAGRADHGDVRGADGGQVQRHAGSGSDGDAAEELARSVAESIAERSRWRREARQRRRAPSALSRRCSSSPAPSRPRRRAAAAPPSTGGTDEPNDAPAGDMFFRPTGTNPFVDTREDALSTFALDVDTGSCTLARSYLDRGTLPPAEAIRVEEFVNAQEYDDPAPRRGEFALVAEGAPSPFAPEGDYRLLRFAVKGREIDGRRPQARDPDLRGRRVGLDGPGEPARSWCKRALGMLLDELHAGRPGRPRGLRHPRPRPARAHQRPRADPPRDRLAPSRGLDQRRGRAAARLRPRRRALSLRVEQPHRALLGRRRQRRRSPVPSRSSSASAARRAAASSSPRSASAWATTTTC